MTIPQSEFVPTPEQNEALYILQERFSRGEDVSVLAGLAGTGKTALVTNLPRLLGLSYQDVIYMTVANKAAQVLRDKARAAGVQEMRAQTIFSYLNERAHEYHCEECPARDGFPCHKTRSMRCGCKGIKGIERIERDKADLLIVDEASMLNFSDYEKLTDRDTQIIFVGDQGQLGPINAKAGWSAMNNPNYTLKTIMRQVQDSAIITLAHAVRHDTLDSWDAEDTGEVSFKDKARVNWKGFDLKDSIVLVPTDKRRRMFNYQARRELGLGEDLTVGDFIVSHHNNPFLGINNGATAEVLAVERPDDFEYRAKVRLIGSTLPEFWTSILCEELDGDLREATNSRSRKGHWVYAYAMTVHKAQGSEWENVLVAGEQYWGSEAEKRCWRYTAYTRARSRLVIAP